MSDDPQPGESGTSQAEPGHRAPRCDHICRLDDGHVDRGELHQYGYELPSPRAAVRDHAAVTRERDALRAVIRKVGIVGLAGLLFSSDEADAISAARAALGDTP